MGRGIMKKSVLAAIAALALGGGSAAAEPGDFWTGCYIGGNAVYTWSDTHTVWTAFLNNAPVPPVNVPLSPPNDFGSNHTKSWGYGGQIGCDYQFNGNWTIGVRGMWDGLDESDSKVLPLPNIGNSAGEIFKTKLKSFETLGAKIGYALGPAFMIYGVAGVAWSQNRTEVISFFQGPPTEIMNSDENRTGYNIGIGGSWRFSPNLELVAEYDHLGFGNHDYKLDGTAAFPGEELTIRQKQSVDLILVGLNYRFFTR